MCLTYCHKRRWLYWNHQDCHPADCELAPGPHGRCATCRHRQEATCGLTRMPLPAPGGCCHHNVEPVSGPQEVTREMLAPVGISIDESELYLLKSLEVPYQLGPEAEVFVEPDELGLPITYGLGTEHRPAETFDWSAWFGLWCREEV